MLLPSYSLTDLHNRYIEDKKFNRLYTEWVKSGYNKQFKPSLDRINCKLSYTFRNIHLITWAENRYKQRMELRFVRARTVYMMMGDKVVARFKSVSHAVKETGLHQGNISSCLHGKRHTSGGYRFSYEVIGNIHE